VWNRPKQGFVLPFADWMRGPLAAEVGSALGEPEFHDALGIDGAMVRDIWSGFLRNHSGITWSRPWALYALARWATAHAIEGLGSAVRAEAEAALG